MLGDIPGVDFSFHNALVPSNINDICDYFDVHESQLKYGNLPSLGEIGCSISHFLAIKDFTNSKYNNLVILEDDAQPTHRFYSLMSRLETIKLEDDAVYVLGHSALSKTDSMLYWGMHPIKKEGRLLDSQIGRSKYMNWCGTVAYMLNKNSSQKFVSQMPPQLKHIADDWRYIARKTNLKIYHSKPLFVLENITDFSSAIEKNRLTDKRKKYVRDIHFKSLPDYLKYLKKALRRRIKNELFFG